MFSAQITRIRIIAPRNSFSTVLLSIFLLTADDAAEQTAAYHQNQRQGIKLRDCIRQDRLSKVGDLTEQDHEDAVEGRFLRRH